MEAEHSEKRRSQRPVQEQPSGQPTTTPEVKPKATRATADCENAVEQSCSCRCRSKYHGKPHPEGWKNEEGCHPLDKDERKAAKKAALYAWRKAHPEKVSAYMKGWRAARKEEAQAVGEEGADDEGTADDAS